MRDHAPAITVHLAGGYTEGMHLLPAFVELDVFLLGMALSHSHLCKPASELMEEWAHSRAVAVTSRPSTRSDRVAPASPA